MEMGWSALERIGEDWGRRREEGEMMVEVSVLLG